MPIWWKNKKEQELEEEVRSHLEMAARDHTNHEQNAEAAQQAARRAFGNISIVKETVRDLWRWRWLEDFFGDVLYGVRILRTNPGFTAVAVLTLALGIGANTAIFSVVNAVLLRPLPFAQAQNLVWLWGKSPEAPQSSISPPDFQDYRRQNHAFQNIAALTTFEMTYNLTGQRDTRQVQGALASADLLQTLGTPPILGREFTGSDEQFSEPQVAMISKELWQKDFGANLEIIGQPLQLDGVGKYLVVGIAPASLKLLSDADLWLPTPMGNEGMHARQARFLNVVGRLRDGVKLPTAAADLAITSDHLRRDYPQTNSNWEVTITPISQVVVGDVRPALLLLLGGVGLVTLIACANVANLLLARATSRQREIAMRTALGAPASRIIRQLLTESMLLALAGGGFGIVLGLWAIKILKSFGPEHLPRLGEISLDWHVLAFTSAVSLFAGVFFGLAPALQLTNCDFQQSLREGSRSTRGSHVKLQNLFVVAEIALSLVLLVGAGLLLKSFWNLVHVDSGMKTEHVLSAKVVMTGPKHDTPAGRAQFMSQLLTEISAIPGVEHVGATSELPLSGQWNETYFTVAGATEATGQPRSTAGFRKVTPDYFATLGIPILSGRGFLENDSANSLPVVLINEPFAKDYFAHENPIGKVLSIDEGEGHPVQREIVGVVGGINHRGLNTPAIPELFLAYQQSPTHRMAIVVRSTRNPRELASALQKSLNVVDFAEAFSAPETMDDVLSKSVQQPRFVTLLLAVFSAVAVLLACTGVYGIMSYAVSQRTRELGVRIALGASPSLIIQLVLGSGGKLIFLGLFVGLVGSYAAAQALSSMLFHVSKTDLSVVSACVLALSVAAIVACYVPARRATRVDPLVALRCE